MQTNKDMNKFQDVTQALEAVVAPERKQYPTPFILGLVENWLIQANQITTGIAEKEFVLHIRVQVTRYLSNTAALANVNIDLNDLDSIFQACGQYLEEKNNG